MNITENTMSSNAMTIHNTGGGATTPVLCYSD
jgi:hypothetical protein